MSSGQKSNGEPVKNWVSIAGHWSFEGKGARYLGPAGTGSPVGIALSDANLRDGTVKLEVTFDTDIVKPLTAGIILGYGGQDRPNVVVALGATDTAYGMSEFDPTFGWRAVLGLGFVEDLQPNRPYHIEAVQQGQVITLHVDGVRVFRHVLRQPLSGNQVGLFAWGSTKISYENVVVAGVRPRLFVAMQFSEPFNTLFDKVIVPTGEHLGFDVIRVDKIARPGIIFEDIKREISEAKALVAEITAPNQNVFYELGYAHALNKPTVLLAQRGRELPFDIRSYRVVFYDDTIGGMPELEETLQKHLDAILQEG
jgi:hypothetical protein